MPSTETPTIAALLKRADRLYTLPTVALETLRLTAKPNTDAQSLCDCIQRDPAIAAKVLRAVNSPLYGLSSEVDSLPQAIALLGVEPLKLLVLGFALPEKLFENLTGESLRAYWEETLTTATAARAIAKFGWGRLGDEAFVLGLMQGVGRLLLLGQFGEDYARLLASARGPLGSVEPVEPLERKSLGFDYRELSAAMLRHWALPERLAEAIERQADEGYAEALKEEPACLARSLRLATLLARLVVRREFDVLPTLLEEADRYCGMGRDRLDQLIATLSQQVQQVAQALSVELSGDSNYHELLVEAHAQLAIASQRAAGELLADQRPEADDNPPADDDQLCVELLDETERLAQAVSAFLGAKGNARTPSPIGDDRQAHAGRSTPRKPHTGSGSVASARKVAVDQAERAAIQCRNERKPLSLVLVQVGGDEHDADAAALHDWISRSAWTDELVGASWNRLSESRCGLLLPDYDKADANRLWSDVVNAAFGESGLLLNVGIAGVTQLSRGFEAAKLIDAAERCLDAAIGVAGPSVKSIELF